MKRCEILIEGEGRRVRVIAYGDPADLGAIAREAFDATRPAENTESVSSRTITLTGGTWQVGDVGEAFGFAPREASEAESE